MTTENIYTIKLIEHNNNEAFQITGPEGESFIFDYSIKKQFSLYQNNIKIIEAESYTELCAYTFSYNNIDRSNNVRFYSNSIYGKNYEVVRDQSNESMGFNGTWCYSLKKSIYTLIDKNAQDLEIARINGLSLDGQNSGILNISSNIPKDCELIIVMTACIVWYTNLSSPWNNFVNLLNGKK